MEDIRGKADKAYNGEEQYIQFGQWSDVEQKTLKFRGTREESSFWVKTKEGHDREGSAYRGIKEIEITVNEGDTVFAMNAYICFQDTLG